MDRAVGISSRGALWLALAVVALAVARVLAGAGIGVTGVPFPLAAMVVSAVGLALLRRNDWPRSLGRAADAIELLALFGGMALAATLASYCIAGHTVGHVDDALAAADRTIGFDWVAAYRLVHDRPLLWGPARTAYLSIFLSPTLLLVGLALSGRTAHARRFLLAYGLALIATLGAFAWLPAVSAGHHYLPAGQLDEALVMANHMPVIDAMRAGTLRTIALDDLRGLITFPSFHAASGLLFMWGGWPLPRLRGPLVAMNVAMIAVTPVIGSHYLMDVIAGMALAALAISAVRAAGRVQPASSTTFPTWSPASR